MAEVFHVYRGDASSSSRIKMQLSWVPGSVFDKAESSLMLSLLRVLRKSPGVMVFHGQSTLPYLLISWIFIRLTSRRFSFVYDMHDLNEKPIRGGLRSVLRYQVFYFLEFLLVKSGVSIITVSKGLSRIFYKRFRYSPKVVYNVAFEVEQDRLFSDAVGGARERSGLVYFGLIKPDRVPLFLAREVIQVEGQGVFDVYGRVPIGSFGIYASELEKLASDTALRLCGPYKPEAMGFLEKYRYSWLCFESDRLNIRYCMPNKLFQSLSAGLCCVISDRLVEARTLFGDACVSYRDFLRICEGELESPVDKIDWKDVEARMQKVAERSRAVFLEVCSA